MQATELPLPEEVIANLAEALWARMVGSNCDPVDLNLRAKLALERRKIAKEGKYLFEGDWLTAEQIHGLRRRLTWKALGILFQLVLLFGFMSLMNLAFLWVLKFALPE